MTSGIAAYEAGVQPARERFAAGPGIVAFLDPKIVPELLELTLIYYSATGVRMTDLVEGWL